MDRFLNSVSCAASKNDPVRAASCSALAAGHCFFLPLHYTPSYDYPLIVWLHSNGHNENQIDDVMPHISVRNYIGVGVRASKAADSIGHRFDWHQSPAAISSAHEAIITAVDDALNRFSVHPKRVVLVGYRDGGTMALRIAMRQPDRFAAAVSLGGLMPQGAIRNIVELRKKRLAMLWQWGGAREEFTSDNLKADCQMAMAIGGKVEIRQYPGDDEMNTVVLKDIDQWIMRCVVNGSSTATSDRWASHPTAYSAN